VILDLETAALSMIAATVCGGVIGSERQARQRMAGVRTNALVALGAASFVIFAALFPGDASPTRVPAQIVSGIGFLGAGIIFREGFNVHGLNTAATLWCSAAVGMMSGAGAYPLALLLTGVVMVINLGVRPLVNWIDRRLSSAVGARQRYRVVVTCRPDEEFRLRSLMLQTFALGGLSLSQIEAMVDPGGAGIELSAIVAARNLAEADLERAIAPLAADPGLHRLRWEPYRIE